MGEKIVLEGGGETERNVARFLNEDIDYRVDDRLTLFVIDIWLERRYSPRRTWSRAHGIVLNLAEARSLYEVLKKRFGEEK